MILAQALLDGMSWVVLAVHAEARRVPELGLYERFLAGRHALVTEVVWPSLTPQINCVS